MILDEYALIPDIFDPASYSSKELATTCLSWLKEPLLNEALVRDLRAGEWSECMKSGLSTWDNAGKELLIKLFKQNRIYSRDPAGVMTCSDGESWTQEALASHRDVPLTGIIGTSDLAKAHRRDGPIAAIDKLTSAQWWRDRSPSHRTSRTTEDYLGFLEPLLLQSNSLMFIDRFLDPRVARYNRFVELLERTADRNRPAARIEIHRVCYIGSGRRSEPQPNNVWEDVFNDSISDRLDKVGISAEIFIWDNFHDRFLITDLIGVGVSNGFDTTADPSASVTWTRLGRQNRDDIQREFDPNSHRHNLRHRFSIGSAKTTASG